MANNDMIVNTKFTPNLNLKETGNGIFDDIETNLMDIVKRGLEESRMLSPEYRNLAFEMKSHPNFVDFQEVPALFCWCSGSESNYNELGGFSGKMMNMIDSYFCTVFYGITGRDSLEMHRATRIVGSEIKSQLIKNLNLNDLMDGPSEFVSLSFAPKPVVYNKEIIPMSGVTFKMIYRQRNLTQIYSNPQVPNF